MSNVKRCSECDCWRQDLKSENGYSTCSCEDAPEYGVRTYFTHVCTKKTPEQEMQEHLEELKQEKQKLKDMFDDAKQTVIETISRMDPGLNPWPDMVRDSGIEEMMRIAGMYDVACMRVERQEKYIETWNEEQATQQP